MPDMASLPVTVKPTGWLYQPFASGLRSGTAPVTVGAVRSTLTVTDQLPWSPVDHPTVHERCTRVSLLMTSGAHPSTVDTVPSSGDHDQRRVTGLRYQGWQLVSPGSEAEVHVAVTLLALAVTAPP